MKINHTHCCYCRRAFSEEKKLLIKTQDHFYPTSRGGYNVSDNRLQCCFECNQWKGARLPDEFLVIVKKHFDLKRKRGTYQTRDFAQIIGSIKHFMKEKTDKIISDYKL